MDAIFHRCVHWKKWGNTGKATWIRQSYIFRDSLHQLCIYDYICIWSIMLSIHNDIIIKQTTPSFGFQVHDRKIKCELSLSFASWWCLSTYLLHVFRLHSSCGSAHLMALIVCVFFPWLWWKIRRAYFHNVLIKRYKIEIARKKFPCLLSFFMTKRLSAVLPW